MQHWLLIYKFGFKVIGPIDDATIGSAETLFRSKGYQVKRVGPPPSARTLQRWKKWERGRTCDGCWTRGLESCCHGYRAWLSVYRDLMR